MTDAIRSSRPCATELVGTAMRSRLGVVSTQVLQQYFNAATPKLRLERTLARRRVELIATMHIIQAAAAAGCRELLTEDMQSGFRHGAVVVVDPFGPDGGSSEGSRL